THSSLLVGRVMCGPGEPNTRCGCCSTCGTSSVANIVPSNSGTEFAHLLRPVGICANRGDGTNDGRVAASRLSTGRACGPRLVPGRIYESELRQGRFIVTVRNENRQQEALEVLRQSAEHAESHRA